MSKSSEHRMRVTYVKCPKSFFFLSKQLTARQTMKRRVKIILKIAFFDCKINEKKGKEREKEIHIELFSSSKNGAIN